MTDRVIPAISLKDFENRKEQITQQLVDAAQTADFLTLVDHGISIEEIEAQFAISKAFFDLPAEVKLKTPYNIENNNGREYKAQTRPLTGVDQKGSLWLQPTPNGQAMGTFQISAKPLRFSCPTSVQIFLNNSIALIVVYCFGVALGFPEDYFKIAMDVTKPDCITQLRFLHYPPASESEVGTWRAGTHTDIGCLTLLFQRNGEDGLEICPGRETHISNAIGDTFFPLPAETGPIVVNIGDMLMAWSDDHLKANFHRVRAKDVGKSSTSRYSIAYFNQGREDFVFQGPKKKYPPMMCGEYFHKDSQNKKDSKVHAHQHTLVSVEA